MELAISLLFLNCLLLILIKFEFNNISARRDAAKILTKYQGIREESIFPAGRIVEKVFTNTNKEIIIDV